MLHRTHVPKIQARDSSSVAPAIIKKEVGNSGILDLMVNQIIVGGKVVFDSLPCPSEGLIGTYTCSVFSAS